MLFFLLLMLLFRSICHQVSNQADKLALLAIILLLVDVSPTYLSGLPQAMFYVVEKHCPEIIARRANLSA